MSKPPCFGTHNRISPSARAENCCSTCFYFDRCVNTENPSAREPWDNYFLRIAQTVATRATCGRRKVGCVLVNKRNKILATGFNGVPRGFAHCSDHPCPGAGLPSGQGLDKCLATHAEANALLQCSEVDEVHTCYVTASPCIHCTKLLLNTGASRVVFLEEYPHTESKKLWLSVAQNSWVKGTI